MVHAVNTRARRAALSKAAAKKVAAKKKKVGRKLQQSTIGVRG